MKCPECHEEVNDMFSNEDGSITCHCGRVLDPSILAIRREKSIDTCTDKVLDATDNLRSLIVTLSTGQDVTFSYPKDLEPTEEVERETWRDLLTQHIIVTCIWVFCVGIANTVFDDEIEVKRG